MEKDSGGRVRSVSRLCSARARLQLAAGEARSALETLETAGRHGVRNPNLSFYMASAWEYLAPRLEDPTLRREAAEQAALRYSEAVQLGQYIYNEELTIGVGSWLSRLRMGSLCLRLGRDNEALACFEAVLADESGLRDAAALGASDRAKLEATLGMAHGRIATHDHDSARELLKSALEDQVPDAIALQALSHQARGEMTKACELAQAIQGREAGPFLAPWRGALARQLLQSPEGPEWVFIGGVRRSGATLLRAMLSAHRGLRAGPESKLVPLFADARRSWEKSQHAALDAAGIDGCTLDRATRAFLSQALGDSATEARLVDKNAHNCLHFELLARLYPRASFIHVSRDPRAVVSSLLRQDWRDPLTGDRFEHCEATEAAAAYWARTVSEARYQGACAPGRVFQVRYEDLCSSPRRVMTALLDWLGEPWDEAVLDHHSHPASPDAGSSSEDVSVPIHRRAIQRWHGELDADQLGTIARVTGWGTPD